MATPSSDRRSWQALVLALAALALPVIGLVAGVVQGGLDTVLLGLAGTVVALLALMVGIPAFVARREANKSRTLVATALGISVLVIMGTMFLLPAIACYTGGGCGGGG